MWIFAKHWHTLHFSRYLEKQVENLEMEVEQARHAAKTTQNPELLRYSKGIQKALQTQVGALEAENSKLRSTNSQLEEQLSQEQIKRETLQNREWQRQNNERERSKREDS
jgi:SUMO ligase MMS21 Smc5/6 complex component